MRRLLSQRAIPAVLGVLFSLSAFWLFLLDREPGATVFLDWLWPWVFALAGALAITAAFNPTPHLLAYSGALMVGAATSRAVVLVLTVLAGEQDVPEAEYIFRAIGWLGYGFALSVIWAHVLMPAQRFRE